MYSQKPIEDALMKLAWKCLEENMVLGGEMTIDRRTSEILIPEVIYMPLKYTF